MVNLEWYRSFVQVYRVGTVSGAAESLHLTQPAVSQHIAGLEATLGTPLFQRLPRRMSPTEAGKRLYTQVVGAIESLEAVPTKATQSDAPLLIRLGAPPEFFSEYMLPRLGNDYANRFVIQFGLVEELISQLLAGKIDCAIATQKIVRPELEYQRLYEESFWLVGPPSIVVPITTDVMQADLTKLEAWLRTQVWLSYGEELPIIRRFWRVVFGQRLAVVPQFVIPELRSIRSAIAQGLGFSVLPDYLCAAWERDGRLQVILRPDQAVTNVIWLAYRKGDARSAPVTQLLNCLGVDRT
jgi:DNA-binding transcriptional LysR family regulator